MTKKTVRIGDHEIPVVKINDLPRILGVKPGDAAQIITPQCTRPASDPPPTWTPTDRADYESLSTRSTAELREIGLRLWGDAPEGSGNDLWLFPGEWYAHLPAGLPIVDINGNRETFDPGVTDNDIRFGCLAYGVIVPVPKQPARRGEGVRP